MLYFGTQHLALDADGGEWPDEAVGDDRAGGDGDRTADVRVVDDRPRLDDDSPVDRRALVDLAVDARLDAFEQQPVRLQQRCELAGIDPPTVELLGANAMAMIDQPLDRLGDLQLAARRRRDRCDRLVDRAIEQVDTDEGEIGWWLGRLLDQSHDITVVVEDGDAEALRIGYLLQQDLRARRRQLVASRLELPHEAGQVLFEQVVAEVHDEVVVAQELPGDDDAVG